MAITLSFDIGYASIGWCVLSSPNETSNNPEFLGTGVVTFPTDDCLASKRRDLRRTRRHIRSTRQRIERMKRWLVHCGVLTRTDLDKPGHPAPFLLAAAALQGHRTLNAWELWTVLRWYAHNRGYDGNSLWSSQEQVTDDDTEKETNAKSLMTQHGTTTMCETVCACLGLHPTDHANRISSTLPYKTLNAAYPREIVRKEVAALLTKHARLIGENPSTLRLILKHEALIKEEREQLKAAGIRLPLRYHGGLLFGQLVPRFDNRIISRCPITYAAVHDAIMRGTWDGVGQLPQDILSHLSETSPPASTDEIAAKARHLAEKFSKVPAAKSKEFLEYRFARILANLRAGGDPISPDVRLHLFDLAKKQGSLSPADLKKALAIFYPKVKTNVSDYFTLHPDSAKALVLDPVADAVRKASGKTSRLGPIWSHLVEFTREKIRGRWSKNQPITLAEILQINGDAESLAKLLEPAYAKANKTKNGKPKYADFNQFLIRTTIAPEIDSGRAPYARPVLSQVVAEVLAGYDPAKPAAKTSASEGERKPADGILYPVQNPGSRVNELRAERPLDQLTNNHLVRHRMLILERLVEDIAAEFDIPEDPRIIVEVARELKEFSGKDARAIKTALGEKLKDFKAAVTYLEKNAPDIALNGSLIRKARIAMDMDWQCPFTGDRYDAYALGKLEREHIIPYASRNSNALHALVLTWPEVNRMKGKRSARQFVEEEGGKPVSGRNLTIHSWKPYEDLVNKLKVTGHDDDRRRQKARKALLLTTQLEEKDLGFTDGQLTQTSQLMKIAMRGLKKRFPAAKIDPIPGPVTAEVRKAWRLTGTLSLVCPEVLVPDAADEKGRPKVRPKDEIRGLTHMHHALDAATLALIAHYFPLQKHGQDQKGTLWKAMLKRTKSEEEIKLLTSTRLYKRSSRPKPNTDGTLREQADAELTDLPAELKNALARSLAQARVMQHIPADRSGAKAELTTWGIVSVEGTGVDARVKIRQKTSMVENGIRKRTTKHGEERAGKLLGLNPRRGTGKLKNISGAMVIGENYGVALDPVSTVIPFHDVTTRLSELRKANGGKPIRVLRNGMLIRVENWTGKEGIWRIMSCKASLKLDLARPQENKASWREVAIASLCARGLSILPRSYTGHSLMD
jgi:CRISPR-associated endonuclease Csn1